MPLVLSVIVKILAFLKPHRIATRCGDTEGADARDLKSSGLRAFTKLVAKSTNLLGSQHVWLGGSLMVFAIVGEPYRQSDREFCGS
jgi:hypothetical protein